MTESQLINVTLEYGQGFHENRQKDETAKTKIYDCTSKVGTKILDYHIHKLVYTLNSNQTIQSLKCIYKSLYDGHTEILLDTTEGEAPDQKEEEIVFGELEEIINILFYVSKEDKLVSICLETNQGNNIYIGDNSKGEVVKDDDLVIKKNIVVGFGMNANKRYGVTSLFCYIVDKNKYGMIQFIGLLQLRAKLKINQKFKEDLESRKEMLNSEQKLLVDVCNLPDAAFFPISTYVMSH